MEDYKTPGYCKKCKALKIWYKVPFTDFDCELYYQIDKKMLHPKTPCPRPLTYLQMLDLKKDLKNGSKE